VHGSSNSKKIKMTDFLKNGKLGIEHGFLIPVTTEDPSLLVLETKPDSTKWGIAIFLGDMNVCIGVINDDNFLNIHKNILSMSVTNRKNEKLGSVWTRLENRVKTK
jgi:hypothetical protein